MPSRASIQMLSTTKYQLISREVSRSSPAPPRKFYLLKVRTDSLAAQRADGTISFVADLLRRRARLEPANIELNPLLKPFADVWPQLVLEDELVKHCNGQTVSTRVVVPAPLREKVFRSLHENAHHGYEAIIRRISQRFWWPCLRNDVCFRESLRNL